MLSSLCTLRKAFVRCILETEIFLVILLLQVIPSSSQFKLNGKDTNVLLQPYSFTAFDVVQETTSHILIKDADSGLKYSF